MTAETTTRWWCRASAVVLGACAAVALLARASEPLVVAFLAQMEDEDARWQAPVLVVLAYVGVSFPLLHGYALLTLASGFLFGVLRGLAVVLTGATLGATLSWAASKGCWSEFIRHRVGSFRYCKAVLRAVEKEPFRIVFLCRLLPIPFGIMNAILSLSKIRVHVYVLGTCLGLIPEAILGCYFGSTLRSLHEIKDRGLNFSTGELIAVTGTVIGIGMIVWVLIRAGREALREADEELAGPESKKHEVIV